jgi:GGDEF domain-containing protein
MKSKSITIYTIIISFVFAAAVFFFCYSLGHEYVNGSERTGRQFDHLAHDTSAALSSCDVSSQEFNSLFNKACGNLEDYAFITLKNSSSLLYVYPDSSVTSAQNISHFCKVYVSSFTVGGIPYVLTSSMYILRPSSIFYYARFSFIIILAATAFAAILIIYLHLSEKTEKEADNSSEVIPSPDEDEPAEEQIVSEDSPVKDDMPAPSGFIHGATDDDTFVNPEAAAQIRAEARNKPEGLFSPVTGFGWEQYLEPRLDSELVRAASSEQDLSLYIIRIPSLSFKDEPSKKICSYLLEQFQVTDMLFEYKSDGFAVIKDNTAVDEAVALADSLYNAVSKILKECNTDLKCAIGISSRSVRMLPGKRLIQEAAEALEHAFSEPDFPIIAFRANADKYRKFIENKN